MKETEAEKRERRQTDLDRLLAAAADHHLFLRASALPEKEDRTPGRPAMFPNFVMLLFGQAISVFGSAFVHVTDAIGVCALSAGMRGFRPPCRGTAFPWREASAVRHPMRLQRLPAV